MESIFFLKVCYEKSAQTDVSKEMCILILKWLKYLKTVLSFPWLDRSKVVSKFCDE